MPIDRTPPPLTQLPPGWQRPDLGPVASHPRAQALMSARSGGVSQGAWHSCNLGDHVQDDAQAVRHNRDLFARHLGAQPVWLQQVHGHRVLRLGADSAAQAAANGPQPVADGAFTTEPGVGCVVMVADCLPILLSAPQGRGVAALHAGWRGLAGIGQGMVSGQGIVHSGVHALCEAVSCDPVDLSVWLGPCIGPSHFEVGAEVLVAFGVDPHDVSREAIHVPAHPRFAPRSWVATDASPMPAERKWLADLPGLARDALSALGVQRVSGGDACTVSDAARFFSYRRDGLTGRLAAGICLR